MHYYSSTHWSVSWAEAPIKIARMTLTIKLDGNWSSFQLANSAPPLSVTDSAIAPSARMCTSRSQNCHDQYVGLAVALKHMQSTSQGSEVYAEMLNRFRHPAREQHGEDRKFACKALTRGGQTIMK